MALLVETRLQAKPGCEAALEDHLAEFAARVRSEPGCAGYEVTRSRHDAQRYLVLERYVDDEALTAHANAEHTRDAFPQLMECVERPPELALFDALDA